MGRHRRPAKPQDASGPQHFTNRQKKTPQIQGKICSARLCLRHAQQRTQENAEGKAAPRFGFRNYVMPWFAAPQLDTGQTPVINREFFAFCAGTSALRRDQGLCFRIPCCARTASPGPAASFAAHRPASLRSTTPPSGSPSCARQAQPGPTAFRRALVAKQLLRAERMSTNSTPGRASNAAT